MNELLQRLTEKTGLSQDKAQDVLNIVVGYLKERLPAPMVGHLDSLLAGGAEGESGGLVEKAKSMAQGLGGILGKKEE